MGADPENTNQCLIFQGSSFPIPTARVSCIYKCLLYTASPIEIVGIIEIIGGLIIGIIKKYLMFSIEIDVLKFLKPKTVV